MSNLVPATKSAYAAAGVNIDSKMDALKSIKTMVAAAKTVNVVGGIGSFGGLCRLPQGSSKDTLLVSSTDGVGTRANFVDVPMLTTDKPGSFVLDFQGTAVGICCTCGQDVGTARYSIDGGKAVTLDMVTEWSGYVHIPWVYVLADGLEPGRHTLRFEVLKGERTGCHIRNFVVNGN